QPQFDRSGQVLDASSPGTVPGGGPGRNVCQRGHRRDVQASEAGSREPSGRDKRTEMAVDRLHRRRLGGRSRHMDSTGFGAGAEWPQIGAGEIMTGPSRMRAAAFLAAIALIGACRGTDTVPETYISIENPEIAAGLVSMRILGIRPGAGDTLPIHFWRHGEVFPGEAALPPALSGAFTLLAQGFKGGLLVYQSRSVIAGGNARKPVRDFRLEAPALTEVPVLRTARVGDAVVLLPSWETRPGYYRQTDTGGAESFTPEAEYAWTREGEVAGRDTVLRLAPIVLADAGAYLFSASNLAGEDNQEFRLIVRHMLPRIAGI